MSQTQRVGLSTREAIGYIFESLSDDIDKEIESFLKDNPHYQKALESSFYREKNEFGVDEETMLRVHDRVNFDLIAQLYLPKPAIIYREYVKTVKKKKKKKCKLLVK